MLVGVVDMTTTIKVGEWGKKYWGKSKCHETNIRDIEPFFKKMVIISIFWFIFWILKKKGFFCCFCLYAFYFYGWYIHVIYHACLILYIKAHVQSSKHNWTRITANFVPLPLLPPVSSASSSSASAQRIRLRSHHSSVAGAGDIAQWLQQRAPKPRSNSPSYSLWVTNKRNRAKH